MKNKWVKVLSLLLVMAFFVVLAVGSGSSEPAQESDQTGTSVNAGETKNDTQEEKTEYALGETGVTVWTNSIGTNWIRAFVPVTNTGTTNLYLSTGTFDIENADGSLEATLSMVSVYPQVIKPGETAYYFEETTYDGVQKEDLKVVPHVKAEKAKVDPIRFDVSDLQVKDEAYLGAKIIGRVENTSDKEESLVYVAAQLFDKNGAFIGQQFTILTDKLAAGEKVGFETSSLSFDIQADDIASYTVYAFPYQYQF